MRIIEHLNAFLASRTARNEVLRFALVGLCSVVLQYLAYYLLLFFLNPYIALPCSYLISLAFNFYLTTRFTFKVKASKKRGIGFLFSHLVNFLLQFVLLHVFMHCLQLPKQWALIPVLAVCVPVNFLLVRYFVKK